MLKVCNKIMLIDTETADINGNARSVHDLGYVVIDLKADKVEASKRFLITEAHIDNAEELNASDFYKGKKDLYDVDKEAYNYTALTTYKNAITEMIADINKYNVKVLSAYNLDFDLKALTWTAEQYDEKLAERLEKKLSTLKMIDLYRLACYSILRAEEFIKFATENNIRSHSGKNIGTHAEACFKYINNRVDYEEEHTALKDVYDELQILKYLINRLHKNDILDKQVYGIDVQAWKKVVFKRWRLPQAKAIKEEKRKEVKTMKKIRVYLDMDGTIADLYNENGWLEDIIAENTRPFDNAKPMTTEETLYKVFPKNIYEIAILSMTPKDAKKEYCNRVARAKDEWLNRYFPTLTKRIYLPYGNNKNLKNSVNAILVDDSKAIRETYRGTALNPAELWGWPLTPMAARRARKLPGKYPPKNSGRHRQK